MAGRYTAILQHERVRQISSFLLELLVVIFIITCVTLIFTEQWLLTTWSELAPDEILYHLRAPLTGTNPDMLGTFALRVLVPTMFILMVLCALLWILRYSQRHQRMVVVSFMALSLCGLGYAIADFNSHTGVISYIADYVAGDSQSDFIQNNYVNPQDVAITFPESKRNLVYIFLESMETTYADKNAGGAFEKNTIPELVELAQEGDCFSGDEKTIQGAFVLPGCTWTMGGIFAQTAGLPLKIPINGNSMDSVDSFFPRLVALGDILEDEGYHQCFLIGSDANFGGRDHYFSSHGSYHIHDWAHAVLIGEIPPNHRVFWGYEDEQLFSIARSRMTSFSENNQPFNLTLLTVDTHFEDGYVCQRCRNDFGDDQYSNVMACSSSQVAQLIDWMRQQPFWSNTTVVLAGDHLTMDSNYCESVPADYQRKSYVSIINGAAQVEDSHLIRSYSTLDLFPTTLAALGVQIPGDRLGLGTNLYSDKQTLIEEMGLDACVRTLNRHSDFMDRFSGIDVSDELIERVVNSTKLNISLDNQSRITFTLSGHHAINRDEILAVTLEIHDLRSDTTQHEVMTLVDWGDPNVYEHTVQTNYGSEDVPFLEAKAFISLADYSDVLVAELSPPT